MEKDLADALMDFYQKILKPEFDAIKEKNAEHDKRFSEVSGHLNAIYHRLGSLEDEFLMINNRLLMMSNRLAEPQTTNPSLLHRSNYLIEMQSTCEVEYAVPRHK